MELRFKWNTFFAILYLVFFRSFVTVRLKVHLIRTSVSPQIPLIIDWPTEILFDPCFSWISGTNWLDSWDAIDLLVYFLLLIALNQLNFDYYPNTVVWRHTYSRQFQIVITSKDFKTYYWNIVTFPNFYCSFQKSKFFLLKICHSVCVSIFLTGGNF